MEVSICDLLCFCTSLSTWLSVFLSVHQCITLSVSRRPASPSSCRLWNIWSFPSRLSLCVWRPFQNEEIRSTRVCVRPVILSVFSLICRIDFKATGNQSRSYILKVSPQTREGILLLFILTINIRQCCCERVLPGNTAGARVLTHIVRETPHIQ